jgi:hypothetical protein
MEDCIFEYIILKKPYSSKKEKDDIVLQYLQQRFKNTFLKVQAITQLGYSRGGTNLYLPDDIINYIKQFVFNDFTDTKRQERTALSIMKEHEHKLEKYWKNSLTDCRCSSCYKQHFLIRIKRLIYENIVEYVKNK